MNTVGKRLAYYRKRKKMSQQQLAKALLVSRSLVGQWETDKRTCECLPDVCRILEVDEGKILNDVSTPNQTLHADLGLSDEAIEFLKRMNSNKAEASNHLILKTMNLMLSTEYGQDILQAIGRFCFIDFHNGIPIDKNQDQISNPVLVNILRFNANTFQESIDISTSLLSYAMLKAVEDNVFMLRSIAETDEIE